MGHAYSLDAPPPSAPLSFGRNGSIIRDFRIGAQSALLTVGGCRGIVTTGFGVTGTWDRLLNLMNISGMGSGSRTQKGTGGRASILGLETILAHHSE